MTAAQLENETGSKIRDVAAALALSFSVNLSDKHAITMQTHVPQDATAAEIDKLLDKIAGRADRLVARYSVKAIVRQIDLQKAQLKRLVEDLARVDAIQLKRHEEMNAGRANAKPFKRNNQEEQSREGALTTKKRFEEDIARLEAELAEIRAEAT